MGWYTVLVSCMVLLWPVFGSAAMFGWEDPGPKMEPRHVYRFVGHTIEINCSMPDPDVAYGQYLRIIRMSDHTQYDLDEAWHHLVADETMQLRIQNATTKDSGRYWCYLGQPGNTSDPVMSSDSTDVQISELPIEVDNITCVLNNFEDMLCTWCQDSNLALYDYTLHWKYSGQEVRCQQKLGVCGCYFCGSNINYSTMCLQQEMQFHIYFKYEMSLKVDGEAIKEYVVHTNKTLVLAGAVTSLKATPISSSSIAASWDVPLPLKSQLSSITYEVTTCQLWKNISQVQITAEKEITLSDLLPFTQYRITVRILYAGSIYQGNATSVVSQTHPDKPSDGVEFLTFREVNCIRASEACRSLIVYWKIDPASVHGTLRSIAMFVNGTLVEPAMDITLSSHKLEGLDTHKALNISMYYRNEVGQSPTSWTLIPHKGEDVLLVDGYAERDGSTGAIQFSWSTDGESRYQLSLLGCVSPLQDHMCESIWVKPLNISLKAYNLTDYDEREQFALVASDGNSGHIHGLPEDWVCVFEETAPSAPEVIVESHDEVSVCIGEPHCDTLAGRPIEYEIYHGENECSHSQGPLVVDAGCKLLPTLKPGKTYEVCVAAVGKLGKSAWVKKKVSVGKTTDWTLSIIICSTLGILALFGLVVFICVRKAELFNMRQKVRNFMNRNFMNPIVELDLPKQDSTMDKDPVYAEIPSEREFPLHPHLHIPPLLPPLREAAPGTDDSSAPMLTSGSDIYLGGAAAVRYVGGRDGPSADYNYGYRVEMIGDPTETEAQSKDGAGQDGDGYYISTETVSNQDNTDPMSSSAESRAHDDGYYISTETVSNHDNTEPMSSSAESRAHDNDDDDALRNQPEENEATSGQSHTSSVAVDSGAASSIETTGSSGSSMSSASDSGFMQDSTLPRSSPKTEKKLESQPVPFNDKNMFRSKKSENTYHV